MRIARCISPGVVYHVISRFVDRDWLLSNHDERALYLHHLARGFERSDWGCLAYALMSNHIHLALIAGEMPIGPLLKRIHSPFARLLNERRERLGPVMAVRPAAWAVRANDVPQVIAYIHNNPVRGGVVEQARDSRWTSHVAYIGAEAAPSWLAVDDGLRRCDRDAVTFDGYVNGSEATREYDNLAGILSQARKRGAIDLGTPTAAPLEVPLVRRPFARIRPDPRQVIEMASSILELHPARIASRSTQRDARFARRAVVHCALELGLTASEISTALGITRQAGSHIGGLTLDEHARAIVVLILRRFTPFTPSPAKVAQVHGRNDRP